MFNTRHYIPNSCTFSVFVFIKIILEKDYFLVHSSFMGRWKESSYTRNSCSVYSSLKMPKKRVQCPLQTLTYMFAWPSMSGKWAQTIFPPFVPFLGILIQCSVHLQGITALPLACLFRCHFCAVGGFQRAAGSPVIKVGCTFGEWPPKQGPPKFV